MKQWYEKLFENYADTYDKESFTEGTAGEVDFIEREINFDKTKSILDIGCGTGRHSIELAKRGYIVTGFDLSKSQITSAKEKAKAVGVKIDFYRRDARETHFVNAFDLVIMICEGAFPLMETDEMNFKILQNAEKSLNANGKLIFTTLNALYPLYHSVKDLMNENLVDSKSDKHKFDLMTFRESSKLEFCDDSGIKQNINCNERYHTPSEITWYLKTLNFRTIEIFGCKLGAFSRNDKLTTEDFEMLVVAEK